MQGKLSVARGCNEGYGRVDLLLDFRPLYKNTWANYPRVL